MATPSMGKGKSGHVIPDDEPWPIARPGVISTPEPHIISDVVIIVIGREAEAELGSASQVDIRIPRASDRGTVPVLERRVVKCSG